MVPQESACLDISPNNEEHHVLDWCHYNLNKFCQAENVNYRCVVDEIETMARGAVDFLKKNCSQSK